MALHSQYVPERETRLSLLQPEPTIRIPFWLVNVFRRWHPSNLALRVGTGRAVSKLIPKFIFATGFEVGTAYTQRSGFEIYGRNGRKLTDY
jgi:hypothetical protein